MRHLIRHYFDRRSSSLYREEKGAPNLIRKEDGSFGPSFSEYQTQYPPVTTRLRLVNDCGPILSEDFRRQLAASDEHFFLKTHEHPYRRYFDGEYVIHLVRHPGAVFWSYFNYICDNEPGLTPNITLGDVIKGRVPFGSWSEHTQQWLDCAQQYGDRFLILPYEKLASSEADCCEEISTLVGLPIHREFGSFPRFNYWHRTAPTLFRSGELGEWKSHFSEADLELVRRLHYPTMERLGYRL